MTTVAEAFRGLDEERDALRALAETQEAATDFLGHYRRYAKVAAKRKAAGPRQTQCRYEQLGRDLAAAEEAFAPPSRNWTRRSANSRTRGAAHRAGSAPKALEADPAMRDAERLEQLREDAARKEKAARDREADRDRQAGQVQKYADRATQTARRADTGREKLAQALREAAATAADARCARQHQAAVAVLDARPRKHGAQTLSPPAERADGEHRAVAAYLDAPEAPAADILARARRDAKANADRQEQAAAQLGRLLEESATRERQLHAAQAEEGRLSAEVQAAADRVTAADHAVAERMRLLLDAYRSYLSGLAELRVADPDELIAALEGWGVTGEGANPAAAVIDDAARAAGAELAGTWPGS